MQANIIDYQTLHATFDWKNEAKELIESNQLVSLNIAYLAVDKNVKSKLNDVVAFRFIRKDKTIFDITYYELKRQTSKFANVLKSLGIKKEERIFTLAGRIPELYITALGTLKYLAVYCPLFSAFGLEPVFQRLNKGKRKA